MEGTPRKGEGASCKGFPAALRLCLWAFACKVVLLFPRGLMEAMFLKPWQEDRATLAYWRVLCTRWVGLELPLHPLPAAANTQHTVGCWAHLLAGRTAHAGGAAGTCWG